MILILVTLTRLLKTNTRQRILHSPRKQIGHLWKHAFIFKHSRGPFSQSPSTPNLPDIHPLPSQIPFLLNVFSDHVNVLGQIVHMPTVTKMVRDVRGDVTKFTPANEA